MSYVKQGPFVDGGAPAISASVLNAFDNGIANVSGTTAAARASRALVFSADFPSVLRPSATDTGTSVWVCSGSADQTPINAAIAAVRGASSTTGSVQLVGNSFLTTGSILMQTGVTLKGESLGTEIRATSGFTAGIIALNDATVHLSKVSDLWLNGNGQSVHGIQYVENGGQVFTDRPSTNPDPANWIRDLYINACGNSGFAGHGLYLSGGNLRAGHYSDMRINGVSGCGVWVDQAVDSHFHNIEVGSSGNGGVAQSDLSTAPVGDGFYINGSNLMFSQCKAWYSRGHGFYHRGTRNGFVNCQAQDNYSAGYYIHIGRANFTGCQADSNGQNTGATVRAGFYLEDQFTTITGCHSYDRGGQAWQQQYGFQFTSGATYGYASNCITYANALGSTTGTPGTGFTTSIQADVNGK